MVGPSWWLMLPLVGTGIFSTIDPSAGSTSARIVIAAGGAFGLVASIVGHELAHAVAAVRRSVAVERVVVFLLGGYSEMALDGSRPGVEIAVALAGPIASGAAAVVLLGVAAVAPAAAGLAGTLGLLAVVNAGVAAFNLVPAFPLDGGRVLRAALVRRGRTPEAARRIAAWSGVALGSVTALGGVIASLLGSGPSVIVVPGGILVLVLAAAALRDEPTPVREVADKT